MKLGDGTDDKVVEDIISAQKPEDYCTLIYTVCVVLSIYLLVLFEIQFAVRNHW